MKELVMDERQRQSLTRLAEGDRNGFLLHLYGGSGLDKTFTAGKKKTSVRAHICVNRMTKRRC